MRISSLEEYGLRCLLALARRGADGQLSISEIADLEGLSVPYASKLLAILRKAGLVTAVRGRSGGFCLGREPERITLLQVMTALGGPIIDPDHCARFSGRREVCVHQDDCSVHHVLDTLAAYIADILGRTTLQDLVARSAGRPAGPGLIGAEQLLGGAAATTDITPRPAEIDGLARDTQSQQSL